MLARTYAWRWLAAAAGNDDDDDDNDDDGRVCGRQPLQHFAEILACI